MIHETIAHLEARLHDAQNISEETRGELLQLLGQLKDELGEPQTTPARTAQSPAPPARSLEDLGVQLRGLEASHPQLTNLVQSINSLLSNSGI